MKHIVIITSVQFGYHIDTYYYCKYLKNRCKVTYIGWDMGFPLVEMEGVNVISVSRQGGLVRIFRLLKIVWNQTEDKFAVIFIKYFKFLSWLFRLMRLHNLMVLDIRTGSVEKNRLVRFFYDTVLKTEALFFKNITVISRGLSNKLGLKKTTRILPLGAETISANKKSFNECRMLYVGTFYNRRIENLIHGLADYYSQSGGDEKKVFLTIVGDGLPGQLDELVSKAEQCGLSEFVEFRGRVPHDQLKPIFDAHNIGISYIPLTPYFDDQPPTKTFEYLMSGMPVIATRTKANELIVNPDNGILIGDSTQAVCQGINTMLKKMDQFSSDQIRLSCQDYEWSQIVDSLYTYLCDLK